MTDPTAADRVDRAGFQRRWGVHIFRGGGGYPWFSLGIHLDWHTPTLDLHIGRSLVQVGRNNWEGESRLSVLPPTRGDGHTDQCLCEGVRR